MTKIYEPKGRAREYSPLAFNFFKGCTHGCLYCYVPRMKKFFDKEYKHENCESVLNEEELEKSAKKHEGCGKQILLSFVGDPYCGVSQNDTTRVLEILNKYEHKVAILTKGGKRCLNDIEIFRKFGERIKVGSTLTFDNDNDSFEWEKGAANPEERIETLRILSENGIKTWVSFEPVVYPEQTLRLLEKVSKFVDHVKIGKINEYQGIDKKIDWNDFISKAVEICRRENLKFYIKKDLIKYNKDTQLFDCEIDEDYLNL